MRLFLLTIFGLFFTNAAHALPLIIYGQDPDTGPRSVLDLRVSAETQLINIVSNASGPNNMITGPT